MDDIKIMAEEMAERHDEWNILVDKNQKKWLAEYKKLLGKGKMFWGTTFSTYTMFKVFEHAFEDMIEECYMETKEDSSKNNMTRTEVAYGLFGEVVDGTDNIDTLLERAEA